jgi:general secretion pathway protein D
VLNKLKPMLFGIVALLVFGCAEIEPRPFEPSAGHIKSDEKPAGQIPELVQKTPILPAPQAPVELEKYTVVVNEVPAKELLFALARDARINVDIDPRIDGNVTINAVDQTLPQILDRIVRQIDMRYEFRGDNLFVEPDVPFFRTYQINYLNIARDTVNTNSVATSLATSTSVSGGSEGGGKGGGAFSGNNSTTDLTSTSLNRFWVAITTNIQAIIGEKVTASSGIEVPLSDAVITSPETGTISVNATTKQHVMIQEFIDKIMNNVRRQVLIQTSIIEVTLSDEYQAGIDWTDITLGALGLSIETIGSPLSVASGAAGLVLDYAESDNSGNSFDTTLRLLDEFGDVKVLSSPQLMALNNQTAILKRVENKVFFTIDSETLSSGLGNQSTSFDTTIHSLPVGIVMFITPHIAENGEVILHVRPTISREGEARRTIPLPPDVDPIEGNEVPETLAQEMESLIRLTSGQTAVLGGLMIDEARTRNTGIPGLTTLPLVGNLFKTRDISYGKTELVIFIRPVIIQDPSIETDLNLYKAFLNTQSAAPGLQGVTSP